MTRDSLFLSLQNRTSAFLATPSAMCKSAQTSSSTVRARATCSSIGFAAMSLDAFCIDVSSCESVPCGKLRACHASERRQSFCSPHPFRSSLRSAISR
jgi:hypothetical protein